MNGMTTVKIAGKSLQLTFGMMAVEEIGNRQANGVAGWFKMITDIIYGGYVNDQYLEGKAPELSYREISAEVDDMLSKADPQLEQIFKCFNDSKAGEMLTTLVKKKMEEEELEAQRSQAELLKNEEQLLKRKSRTGTK